MNIARRNSQFLGFTQSLLDNERAEHEAWLRQCEEYSKAREADAVVELSIKRKALADLNRDADWDGSESDLVGMTNGEIGE